MSNYLRHAWPLGIRLQLTLWYTAVFTALILLSATAFFLNLQTSLAASFDAELQLRTEQISEGVSNDTGKITIQDIAGELSGLNADTDQTSKTGQANETDQAQLSLVANFNLFMRVLNNREHIVHVDRTFLALEVPPESIAQALEGKNWHGTVTTRDGQAVRLYSVPLIDGDAIFGILQVGESLQSLQNTLRTIALQLFLAIPLLLVLGALGSYWLAGRAFLPIERLTRIAQEIKAGNLNQRVPVPRAHDEVRLLALTFNEMTDRLNEAFKRERRFVADASHELRTPVAAIRSISEVALDHATTLEEHISVLYEVSAEAERLGHLINELLSLARADEGQAGLEHEPVRLDLLAIEVTATIEPLAVERGITLQVRVLVVSPVHF